MYLSLLLYVLLGLFPIQLRYHIQELAHPLLQVAFSGLQAVLRPVQPGMTTEGEADELPQLPDLDGAHDLLADTLEADAVGRSAGLA